jgi:hypothetical protein
MSQTKNTYLLIIAILLMSITAVSEISATAFNGYTLFGPDGGRATYLIDMSNNVYHSWSHTRSGGYSVYLLENGNILRTANATTQYLGGGGAQGVVQEINWIGTVVWEYTYSTTTYLSHHDIEPMPNGNVLIIAWEVKSVAQAVQAGLNRSVPIWPDHIIEVQPSGTTGGTIVWQWHAWDHLIQDYDASKSNYGVVANHPELLDINTGSGDIGPSGGDWMHINGISYNPDLDQIVISSHNLDEFYVIDHSTTTAEAASHSGGNSGMGGDFLYRWGNPSNYDMTGTHYLNVAHCSVWIPKGLQGEGDIMIFNNREGQGTSIVAEIIPPIDSLGHYTRVSGSAFGPATPAWTYTASGFYSNHLGGCQRLPNGNTLIVESTSGRIFEANTSGTVQWEYTYTSEVARALRYGPNLQAPGAAVTSPNGSETWEAGSVHNITWTDYDNFAVASYKLEYSTDGGTNWIVIQDWTTGDPHTYAWTIPSVSATTCRVRVSARDAALNIGTDLSDANFTISSTDTQAPSATVTSPDGGENWLAGSIHNITWTDSDNLAVASYKLESSTDGGTNWITIQDWTSGDPHTYAWTIPGVSASLCRVKVSARDAALNVGNDQSNANFTISLTDTEIPSATITSPNGGENWIVGSVHNIAWTDYDNVGITSFKIEYSTDNGSNWMTIQDWISGDPHTYSWTVPNMTSMYCIVRVSGRDAALNIGSDQSNATFLIYSPGPGTIVGHVYEIDGSTPIADVLVETYNSADTLMAVDSTTAAGEFQITTAAGIYHQHFSKTGYNAGNLTNIAVIADSTIYVSISLGQEGSCEYLLGDINSDGQRLGGDVTYGVRFFKGTGNRPPDSCFLDSTSVYLYVAGDVNGNCEFRGSDITRLVAFFKGTAQISSCHFFPPPIIRVKGTIHGINEE